MSDFLKKAIRAHTSWRNRLTTAIMDGNIPDVATVRSDKLCDLGKWIYGEGKSHEALREYQELKSQHAHFHQTAANVIDLIECGLKAKATADLRTGAFAEATTNVIIAITALRKKVSSLHRNIDADATVHHDGWRSVLHASNKK